MSDALNDIANAIMALRRAIARHGDGDGGKVTIEVDQRSLLAIACKLQDDMRYVQMRPRAFGAKDEVLTLTIANADIVEEGRGLRKPNRGVPVRFNILPPPKG